MLLHFVAVPVAFPVAQGFWTLIAYIVAWCGFPEAGAAVFRVSLAFTSLGAISALAAFAWTQHRLDPIAARQRLVRFVHWLRTATQRRGEDVFSWNPIGRMPAGRYGACRLRGRTRIR